jgi:hypothetical protein
MLAIHFWLELRFLPLLQVVSQSLGFSWPQQSPSPPPRFSVHWVLSACSAAAGSDPFASQTT